MTADSNSTRARLMSSTGTSSPIASFLLNAVMYPFGSTDVEVPEVVVVCVPGALAAESSRTVKADSCAAPILARFVVMPSASPDDIVVSSSPLLDAAAKTLSGTAYDLEFASRASRARFALPVISPTSGSAAHSSSDTDPRARFRSANWSWILGLFRSYSSRSCCSRASLGRTQSVSVRGKKHDEYFDNKDRGEGHKVKENRGTNLLALRRLSIFSSTSWYMRSASSSSLS